MGIWGVGDPRDLDSLGLARAQPGRSAAETEVPLRPPSAGDTACWTLGWTSGSPPLYNKLQWYSLVLCMGYRERVVD